MARDGSQGKNKIENPDETSGSNFSSTKRAQSQGQLFPAEWSDPYDDLDLENLPQVTGIGRNTATELRFRQVERGGSILTKNPIVLFLVFLIALGVVGGVSHKIKSSQYFRLGTIRLLSQVNRQLQSLGAGERILSYPQAMIRKIEEINRKSVRETSARIMSFESCSAIVESGVAQRIKNSLDADGLYLMTSCQAAQDMNSRILATEDPKMSGEIGVEKWASKELALALLYGQVRRRIDFLQADAIEEIQQCKKWKDHPACLLRFASEASISTKRSTEQGFVVLNGRIKSLPNRLQIWFLWAAGQVALKDGNFKLAEQRLATAEKQLLNSRDPFLEREIFRTRVKNAWISSDRNLMSNIFKKVPQSRIRDDVHAFDDMKLLRDSLLSPGLMGKGAISFMENIQGNWRLVKDVGFASWLAVTGLENRAYDVVLRYTSFVEAKAKELSVSDQELVWLFLLKARANLGLNDSEAALAVLSVIGKTNSSSAVIHHLRGLAYLMENHGDSSIIAAMRSFQKAEKSKPSVATFFAIIVCNLAANDIDGAKRNYTTWQSALKGRAGAEWAEFARGLIAYAQGDIDEGIRILHNLAERHPDFIPANLMVKNLREDKKYLQIQFVKSVLTVLPPRSPLGVLALFDQRP